MVLYQVVCELSTKIKVVNGLFNRNVCRAIKLADKTIEVHYTLLTCLHIFRYGAYSLLGAVQIGGKTMNKGLLLQESRMDFQCTSSSYILKY